VEDWLRASSLSKPRKGRRRQGPETIARLAAEVVDGDPSALREEIARAGADVGVGVVFAGSESSEDPPRHAAFVRIRPSLVRARLRLTIRFEPPIHPASCAGILERLARRFAVTKVSAKKRRVRLPPRVP